MVARVKWFRFPRLIGIVVAVYLVAITILFARLTVDNRDFRVDAATTQGTVVALVPKTFTGSPRGLRRRDGVPLAPVISFTVAGMGYTYAPSQGSYRPRIAVGDHVTILYDPADPGETAQVKGEGRVTLPLITVGFGLLFVAVVVVLIRTRRAGIRPPDRRRTGSSGSASGPASGGTERAPVPR